MPRVSVIIPTFNRRDYITASIQSVLQQTFLDFEIIVVDDGSTDGTADLVAAISDERLVYIHQENRGRSAARNRALSIARGEYFAFLDSDDLYLPGKLAMQVAYLDKHPTVGMIYTSAFCIDADGNDLPQRYEASVSGKIYEDIAFFRPVTITLPTVMVRKHLFDQAGGFDEQMHRFEDTDMWRRFSKVTDIHALPVETCQLRTHEDNLLAAQDPDKLIESIEYYAAKVRREDTDIPAGVLRRGLGRLYMYYGIAFMTVPGWRTRSFRMLAAAFRSWPPLLGYFVTTSARRALFRFRAS